MRTHHAQLHTLALVAGLAATGGGLCAAPALAQPAPPAPPTAPAAAPAAEAAKGPTLTTGAAAPALSIAKWVKGEPVAAFEPGKVYVVEFWATWCGPCLAASPHLTKLQAQHASDGLTVIGVTREDPRNTLDRVEQMAKDRAHVMGYHIAWDNGRQTWDAYMQAAQQRGIPTAFVIDRAGKVAFIGHPMLLDMVLPNVLAGRFSEADLNAVRDAEEAMDNLFGRLSGSDKLPPAEALAAIASFESKFPALAGNFEENRYLLMARLNDPGAPALGRRIVAQAKAEMSFATLLSISDGIVSTTDPIGKPDLALALEAAEGANELTGNVRTSALASLARVHAARGDTAKAVEFMTKAVEKAPESAKARFQKELDELKRTGG
jgi:thiol-disulfide isomerase/thioredoxin